MSGEEHFKHTIIEPSMNDLEAWDCIPGYL